MKNKKDSVAHGSMAILTKKLSEAERALLEADFDFQTDLDERNMQSYYEMQQLLKKYLLIKLILFPAHWLLLRVFVGKTDAKSLLRLTKQFVQVIRSPYIEDSDLKKYMDYAI